jgi:hypothetical protein
MLISIYQTVQRYIPKDSHLYVIILVTVRTSDLTHPTLFEGAILNLLRDTEEDPQSG